MEDEDETKCPNKIRKRIVREIKKLDETFDEQLFDFDAEYDSSLTDVENENQMLEKIKERFCLGGEQEMSEDEEVEMKKREMKHREDLHLQQISNEPLEDVEKVMEEIENFNPYASDLTYSTLISLIRGVNIINYGQVGAGKSRSVRELVNLMEIPRTIVLKGKYTAKSFFKKVQQYRDCVLIFDEGDMLLENREISNMIKTLLTNKEAEWVTDKEDLHTPFYGSLIVNMNDYKFGNNIEDKAIINQKSLSTEQIKKKIKFARDYEPDYDIWQKIRDRVIYTMNYGEDLTKKEADVVYGMVEELSFLPSFRIINRFYDVFYTLKNLFGGLSDEQVIDLGKRLARNTINENPVLKIMDNYRAYEEIERKELKDRIAKIKCVSGRMANEEINTLIQDGYLRKINRTKVCVEG